MNRVTDEAVMKVIFDVFNHMDEHERTSWSLEQAKVVVSDQIKWDKERGFTPLPYDPMDFYDAIRALIEQDGTECE